MSSLKKYKKVKYLGRGSYGAAILVELKANPAQKFVIKEIVIGHLKESEQAAARKEAEVLHQMNHSNIVMYIESFIESSKLYIVMEHADGGDLSDSIKKKKAASQIWPEQEVMRIFVQICLALKHVHDRNILHRDLKSQNVFLTSKGIVKLGDFGIAKVLDASEDQARTQIGTPYYLSPEICESRPYGRQSDIWSLGVVLYELVALELPFQASSLPGLIHKIISSEPNWTPFVKSYSPGLQTLTQRLLSKKHDERPNIKDVIQTDVTKTHISKLLSHTINLGKGGSIAAAGGASKDTSEERLSPDMDAEEADRRLEEERARIRDSSKEKEKNDALVQAQAERQRKHEEELELLRKKKKEGARQARVGQDTDVVIASPRGEPVRGGGGLAVERRGSVESLSSDQNSNGPRSVYDDRVNREKSLAEIREERAAAAQAVRAAGGRIVGGLDVYPSGYQRGERSSLDDDSTSAYASQAGYVPSAAPNVNPYSRVGDGGHRRVVSAERMAVRAAPPYNRENGGVAGALVHYNAANNAVSRYAPVAGHNPSQAQSAGAVSSGGEDAARQQFFANREAALQIKARVEAERRGTDIFGGGSQYSEPRERRSLEEPSAEDRIAAVRAQKERDRQKEQSERDRQVALAYEQQREEMRRVQERRQQQSHGSSRDAHVNDPFSVGNIYEEPLVEDRITAVRAQKEKERQREQAERDRLVAAAYEVQREEKRKLNEKRLQYQQVRDETESKSLVEETDEEYIRLQQRDKEAENRKKLKEIEESKLKEELALAARKQRQEAKAIRERAQKAGGAQAFNVNFDDLPADKSSITPTKYVNSEPKPLVRNREKVGPKLVEDKRAPVPIAFSQWEKDVKSDLATLEVKVDVTHEKRREKAILAADAIIGSAPKRTSSPVLPEKGKQQGEASELPGSKATVAESTSSVSTRDIDQLQGLLPKQRRGWGAPVLEISGSGGRLSPVPIRSSSEKTKPVSLPVPTALFEKEESAVDMEGEGEVVGEENVLQRLEDREQRQNQDRQQAKEILRKLRDLKRKEITTVDTSSSSSKQQKSIEISKASGKPPIGMNSETKSSVSSPIKSKEESLVAPTSRLRDSTALFELSDSDGELEKTLDRFLNKVPKRRRGVRGGERKGEDMSTSVQEDYKQSDRSSPVEDDFLEQSEVMEDKDMAGLQCALAEALMGNE